MTRSSDAGLPPKVVVVIDDEADNVDLTILVLQSAGYEAYGAVDGISGIRLAIDRRADIVVLDYIMPPLNGDAVGRALRADAKTRDVKIVMCSGTAERTIRAVFDGYDAFLAKPVDGQRFLEMIATL